LVPAHKKNILARQSTGKRPPAAAVAAAAAFGGAAGGGADLPAAPAHSGGIRRPPCHARCAGRAPGGIPGAPAAHSGSGRRPGLLRTRWRPSIVTASERKARAELLLF